MSIERKDQQQKTVEQPGRRRALKTAAAVVGTAAVSAPFIRSAAAAETTTWKVQTSWPAGVGLQTFKAWCGTIKEKTGGELEFKPFAAKEVVGDFELIDGVKNGVLEAMNSFTLYWAGKLPATAFLSSYLMGLRYPHEWDMFFYSKDGLKVTREIFAKQGLYYVNRIHQHHPFEEADPHDRRLQGSQVACSGWNDRRRLRRRRRQDDAAAGRGSILRAGKGHHRGRGLHWPRRQLGPGLPAGFLVNP